MALILYAIPMFLLLIAIELWVDHKRGSAYYRFNDAINSLSLGMVSRFTGVLKAILPFSIYIYIYNQWALFDLSQGIVAWVIAFVLYDMAYYWAHRFNHRISVMWGSHVVHHNSEEYNLTTALRQTSSPSLFAWLVYLPLAVIGIDPIIFISCASLNLIYQFWVHTRHVDKMPAWFEAIMVTPSHHRVHHALNRDYIDKNYAGVFIIWDKLFGSFQAEKDDINIVYGVSNQLSSWNPIWANLQVYWQLMLDAWRTRNIVDKFKVFFMPPGWRPEDVNQQYPRGYVTTKTMVKYDVELSSSMKQYIIAQFVLMMPVTILFLLAIPNLSFLAMVLVALSSIGSLVIISGLQEQKPWTVWAEPMRILFVSIIFYLLLSTYTQAPLIQGIGIFTLIQWALFYRLFKAQSSPVAESEGAS